MSKKLFVGNLDWSITEQQLGEIFAEFGEVTEAIIILNERNQSKGFGFVTFANGEDADAAIEAMNGKEMQVNPEKEARALVVNEARPRAERPPRPSSDF